MSVVSAAIAIGRIVSPLFRGVTAESFEQLCPVPYRPEVFENQWLTIGGPLGSVFSVDFGIIGTPAPPWREIGGGCIAIAEFTA